MGLDQIKVQLTDWWPRNSRDKKNGDTAIAHGAWASSYAKEIAESRSLEDVLRLVGQIVDNAHDTPKERVWMEFWASVPIFVERQYDKYRMSLQMQDFSIDWYAAPFGRWGITQNETSGRYRTLPDDPYHLPSDVRQIILDGTASDAAVSEYEAMVKDQHEKYEAWLKSFPVDWRKPNHPRNKDYKRAREVLRGVKGTCTMTQMRIVMNLNAFEHIINQRLAPDAQLESRVLALLMLEEVHKHYVASTAIFGLAKKNGWDRMSEEVGRVLNSVEPSDSVPQDA